ncbi:hypothetical protein P692DRAFT_20816058 [Suillus brevipes Sb2]|nr:hypothetical protein P692DRAFT_20816058 [Suillus brevipes Sb2]
MAVPSLSLKPSELHSGRNRRLPVFCTWYTAGQTRDGVGVRGCGVRSGRRGSLKSMLLVGRLDGQLQERAVKPAPILPWHGVLPAKVEDSAKKEEGNVGISSGHSGALNLKLVQSQPREGAFEERACIPFGKDLCGNNRNTLEVKLINVLYWWVCGRRGSSAWLDRRINERKDEPWGKEVGRYWKLPRRPGDALEAPLADV